MKRLPLILVCFFGCRAASTGGISDDIRGFTGHLRQPFGLLRAAGQLRMPIPQRNNCAKHLDEFGLIMMLSEAACPDQARKKTQYFYVMVDGVEILRETKYFLGKYEIEIDDAGNERKLHYISAGDGVFAIVEKVNQADAQIHYIHKKYLGSYDAITNHLGVVEERLSFDPWGRRRNPSTGIVDDGIYSMFDRGFTGHQHLDEFGLINMNGRLYDPVLARFLSPDPFIQSPDNLQNHNRYSYALNNPLIYTDPSGEFVWFIPVIIGAAIGAYSGASIQSGTAAFWDWEPDAWQGAIAGAFIGAAAGGLFSAAVGATGMTTVAANGAAVATKAWGVTSSILNSASINIGISGLSGGGWEGAWKAGLIGSMTGAWGTTGGFGMVKGFGSSNVFAQLGGKLGYQIIGTAGNSIGNNWARGDNPFSRITLGIGPVNLTLGKGQKLMRWQNNLGNISTNSFGLGNLAFGGKMNFDWKNLSLNYTGGIIDRFYDPRNWYSGFGAHSVIGNSNLFSSEWDGYSHELHHLWQSRAFGDLFLMNYVLQGIGSLLMAGSFLQEPNYFEHQANERFWW